MSKHKFVLSINKTLCPAANAAPHTNTKQRRSFKTKKNPHIPTQTLAKVSQPVFPFVVVLIVIIVVVVVVSTSSIRQDGNFPIMFAVEEKFSIVPPTT